jgi:hypothetical protein
LGPALVLVTYDYQRKRAQNACTLVGAMFKYYHPKSLSDVLPRLTHMHLDTSRRKVSDISLVLSQAAVCEVPVHSEDPLLFAAMLP